MDLLLGRVAYEAYGKETGGKNFLGEPMPAWDDLPVRIQNAWDAAVDAIIDAYVAWRIK